MYINFLDNILMYLNNHLIYIIFKILWTFSSTCDLRKHYDCPITHAKIEKNIHLPKVGGGGDLFNHPSRLKSRFLTLGLIFFLQFPNRVSLELIFCNMLIMFHIMSSIWKSITRNKLA